MTCIGRLARRSVLGLGPVLPFVLAFASCIGHDRDPVDGAAGGGRAGVGPDAGAVSDPAACGVGPSRAFVVTSLAFTRESPRGVAPGFDLDGRISDATDERKCGKSDLVDPQGVKGIDNQLALLVPEVEKRVGGAVDGLIQGAIDDGRLLILFDLLGVNSGRDDACVDLEVQLGEGKPTLGTDRVVEAWQTFGLRKENQKKSVGKAGKIQAGTFTVGPFLLSIPIAIFDVSFVVAIRDALIRFTIDDDGNIEGLLGGGVSMDEIADGVKNGAGLQELVPQIRFIGNALADFGYDAKSGECRLLSAALRFKGRPAFIRR